MSDMMGLFRCAPTTLQRKACLRLLSQTLVPGEGRERLEKTQHQQRLGAGKSERFYLFTSRAICQTEVCHGKLTSNKVLCRHVELDPSDRELGASPRWWMKTI
jgi:hypothetical protein